MYWYVRYLGINKFGYCHLEIIVKVDFLKWYTWFKWDNFGYIIDINNFAVVYAPTSVEVGEGITAKFAPVDFASSNTSSICLTTCQLVVSLSLYGVLQVVTVLVYGMYGSLDVVE